MISANIGVSMPVFWLGLMLAYLFAVILKDTPFALPPSGRLTPGASPEPFYLVWGLLAEGEDPAGILFFLSPHQHLECASHAERGADDRRAAAPDSSGCRRRHHTPGYHRPHEPFKRAGSAGSGLCADGEGERLA